MELTANCLVDTHTKVEELILAVMVLVWAEWDALTLTDLLWSLYDAKICMVFQSQWTSLKCAEATWITKSGRHSALLYMTYVFFNCII